MSGPAIYENPNDEQGIDPWVGEKVSGAMKSLQAAIWESIQTDERFALFTSIIPFLDFGAKNDAWILSETQEGTGTAAKTIHANLRPEFIPGELGKEISDLTKSSPKTGEPHVRVEIKPNNASLLEASLGNSTPCPGPETPFNKVSPSGTGVVFTLKGETSTLYLDTWDEQLRIIRERNLRHGELSQYETSLNSPA